MPKVNGAIKPETEILLAELQEEYLPIRNDWLKAEEEYKRHNSEENRLKAEALNKKAVPIYQKMFSIVLPYTKSLTLRKVKGGIYLPPDLIDNAAMEATVVFMSQYKKEDFKISSSFAGMISYKILEALYAPKVKRNDRISSLNEHIENGKSSVTELGDLSEAFNFSYMWQPDSDSSYSDPLYFLSDKKEDAVNSGLSALSDLYGSVDLHTFFLVAFGLIKTVQGLKNKYDFIEHFFNTEQKKVYEATLLEMYKRLSDVA